jgi:hypothetical protein
MRQGSMVVILRRGRKRALLMQRRRRRRRRRFVAESILKRRVVGIQRELRQGRHRVKPST